MTRFDLHAQRNILALLRRDNSKTMGESSSAALGKAGWWGPRAGCYQQQMWKKMLMAYKWYWSRNQDCLIYMETKESGVKENSQACVYYEWSRLEKIKHTPAQ